MAASADGRLLATAGEHERLVKVWTAADATQAAAAAEGTHGRDYTFCYLRHPAPLRSLQWRPPPRDAAAGDDAAAADGGGGAASAAEAAASSECAVLLTLAADGGARLWMSTRSPEPAPYVFVLSRQLRTDNQDSGLHTAEELAEGGAFPRPPPPHRAVAAVHWLQPTARAAPVPGRDDEAPMRTRQSRGAAGRMSTSPVGLETPTLKPPLRDHHDYAAAVLADGTLVIWLVLGLSSSPRRTPEVIVWSSLPQLLPPAALRAHAAGAAAFAHFASGGAAAALGGAAAADQLPSAVSLVHLIDDADAADANGGGTVRLCAIDVDRGAAGDRARASPRLGGHAVGAVVRSVLPHPSLPLVATLDSSGRAVVWGCALQGQPTTDAADATEADATGAATLRYLAALSTPATAAAWLPGATSTQLLVASAASAAIEAHGRTAGGAWATHAAPAAHRRRRPTGGGTTSASSTAATAARRTALASARVVASPCRRARPDAGGGCARLGGLDRGVRGGGCRRRLRVSALAQRGWLGGGATDEVGALVACSADGSAAAWSVRLRRPRRDCAVRSAVCGRRCRAASAAAASAACGAPRRRGAARGDRKRHRRRRRRRRRRPRLDARGTRG